MDHQLRIRVALLEREMFEGRLKLFVAHCSSLLPSDVRMFEILPSHHICNKETDERAYYFRLRRGFLGRGVRGFRGFLCGRRAGLPRATRALDL